MNSKKSITVFNNNCVKKYELIQDDEAKQLGLHRIKALRDFGDVKKGDLGGFVEGEHNLSQAGDCWIYYPATVAGAGTISDNAKVKGPIGIKDISISGNDVLDGAHPYIDSQPDDEVNFIF